jgi:alpha,alpha-trehalase
MPTKKQACTLSRKDFDAIIFDLDGVITQTAKIHAKAWKQAFDFFLLEYGKDTGTRYKPFEMKDYVAYVDGRPRYDGVINFLESRSIQLPYGTPDDAPDKETICGLGNQKDLLFHKYLKEEKVELYPTSIELIKDLLSKGFKIAVVSSSKNCHAILENVGISHLFAVQIDGNVAQQLKLAGKPAPDIFLQAAKELEVEAQRAAIVEDSRAGVQAGKLGKFGCVIGVDRQNQADALAKEGADVIVSDLGEVEVIQ